MGMRNNFIKASPYKSSKPCPKNLFVDADHSDASFSLCFIKENCHEMGRVANMSGTRASSEAWKTHAREREENLQNGEREREKNAKFTKRKIMRKFLLGKL